jgi:prefoldin subunit 5
MVRLPAATPVRLETTTASLGAAPASSPTHTSAPKLAVPVGEFDSGVATIDEGRLRIRLGQETVRRDAADSLLQIQADATTTGARGDEARADATEIQAPSGAVPERTTTGGRLRRHAALRRQRGLVGDVRYVFTVVRGVRSARRELAALEHKQGVRQTSRRRHLVTLGRAAVGTDAFEHAALVIARDALAQVEDERSQHAGAVAASDTELERVRRDREAHRKDHADRIAACDVELAGLAKQLEPLAKEATSVRWRADELRAALTRIDREIAETEASLVSVRAERDPAAIKADLATLRADRAAVQRDEPRIAAELDALNPQIAAIEASRMETQKRRRELEEAEERDRNRTAELLDAIGAKRKVVERAAGDAEAARDRALFELGDRLYVERPPTLAAQLAPIDTIDLELGESDRRMMELREILSNVDRAKLARGAIVIALATMTLAVACAVFVAR